MIESNARGRQMKRTNNQDERFEWDIVTVLVLVLVIMFVLLVIASLGLPRW